MSRILGALFALVLVFGLVFAYSGFDAATLDSFDSDGIPVLEGELTTDGVSLFLEVRGDPMALSGDDAYMAWLVYTGDAEPAGFLGPWDDAYLLYGNWFTYGRQGNVRWGEGSGSTHPWNNQGPLPTGVDLSYVMDDDVGVWTMVIPYAAIDVEVGDTIAYMAQALYGDFEDGDLPLNQSHGGEGFNPLWFSENFQEVVLELVPGDPESADECKAGGWEAMGFSNQGRCIQFVNTGKDSR